VPQLETELTKLKTTIFASKPRRGELSIIPLRLLETYRSLV